MCKVMSCKAKQNHHSSHVSQGCSQTSLQERNCGRGCIKCQSTRVAGCSAPSQHKDISFFTYSDNCKDGECKCLHRRCPGHCCRGFVPFRAPKNTPGMWKVVVKLGEMEMILKERVISNFETMSSMTLKWVTVVRSLRGIAKRLLFFSPLQFYF